MISNLLCSNSNKLIDLVNIFSLKNVIDKPTRISGNTSTLLDPISLSDTLNCNYSDVLEMFVYICITLENLVIKGRELGSY
jgi:hypothetical protein